MKFSEELNQLYSVTENGEIGIWNSSSMTQFHLHKPPSHMALKKVHSLTFMGSDGKIVMATSRVFIYDLHYFENVQVKNGHKDAATIGLQKLLHKLTLKGAFGEEKMKVAKQRLMIDQLKAKKLKSMMLRN